MQLLETTQRKQSALAHYCRTGKHKPTKGVNKANLSQYRRLVFDIIDDMLQGAYPLTYHLLLRKEWSQLISEFATNHACASPQIWYMPKELHQYLSSTQHPLLDKYPYLLELLWFEWLETELYMMADKISEPHIPGNIDHDLLVLNPESHLQHFNYPIHLKNAKSIKECDLANYYLVAHRVPTTGDVIFTDISPAFIYMLELLLEKPYTLLELTQKTCKAFHIAHNDHILNTTIEFVNDSLKSRLILGFAKKSA